MKNILIGLELDDNELSQKIIAVAKDIAKAHNSKCWLVHIAAPAPDFIGYEVGPQYIRDMLAEDFKADHKKIQGYAEALRNESINAEGLLIQGSTADIMEKEIKKLSIDLLVLGRKNHGYLYKAFLGSTTDELISTIEVPLLLVPKN